MAFKRGSSTVSRPSGDGRHLTVSNARRNRTTQPMAHLEAMYSVFYARVAALPKKQESSRS